MVEKIRIPISAWHPGKGSLADFASYEELYEAFKEQIRYYFKYQVITDNMIDMVTEKGIADPFVSCLVDELHRQR